MTKINFLYIRFTEIIKNFFKVMAKKIKNFILLKILFKIFNI